jgi:hypothetical protein
MKTHEYQTKGLTGKAFHKLLIQKDVVLRCLSWKRVASEKNSGSQGRRSCGNTQEYPLLSIPYK